jgi:hypothetical protein
MVKFKVKLENLTEGENFKLMLSYWSKTAEEIPFRFSNANNRIEAQRLKIEDKNGNILDVNGRGHINPRNWEETNTTISDTKSFIYELKGDIEDIGLGEIHLDLVTAKYILKKGEPYYFYHEYEGEQSEKIKIIF